MNGGRGGRDERSGARRPRPAAVGRAVLVGCLLAALAVPGSVQAGSGSAEPAPLPQASSPGSGLIRWHVVAHSDRAQDQALKLAVRDALVAAYGSQLASLVDEVALEAWIGDRGDDMAALANRILAEHGAPYGAHWSLGWETFPETRFGPLVFPEGRYRTFRLILGEGAGQNWWCVLFPPLCVVEEARVTEVEVRPADAAVPALSPAGPPWVPDAAARVEWRWSFLDPGAEAEAQPLQLARWWEQAQRLVAQGAARLLAAPAHAGAPETSGALPQGSPTP